MAKAKSTFWCPSCSSKRVVGLNVSKLHYVNCKDGKRFICWNCENLFTVQELADYGNNMSRILRQQAINHAGYTPRMVAGANEW